MNSDDDDLKTAVLNPSNPAISEALEPRAPAGKITQLDVQGHDTASVFVLADRAQTIGRNATNAIRLNTVGISRTHARIYSDSGGWMVQDLESRNGVRVNGVRIGQPTRYPTAIRYSSASSSFASTYRRPRSVHERRGRIAEVFERS